MQPAFHRAEIARYVGTMRDVAVPRISGWPDGGTLAFDREMRSITLTVLTRTLLSSDIGADAIDEIERLLRVLLSELVARGITANVPGLAWVPTRSNRRFSAANRRLRALLTDIIDGYRRAGADHGDLISILMRARDDDTGAGMTNKQLRDEATTLVIAGSETTGNTIAWACYLLAQHPQVQERLQAGSRPRAGRRRCRLRDPGRLPFTRAVITEALRLYSPVWILPRRAVADVELGGHLLPAGSRIIFSPYALNRDARLHREPDRFDPGRWATDYSQDRDAGLLLPVRAGHQELHRRGLRLDRVDAAAQRHRRPLAAAARRRRRGAPRGQQHPGAERAAGHRHPPRPAAARDLGLIIQNGCGLDPSRRPLSVSTALSAPRLLLLSSGPGAASHASRVDAALVSPERHQSRIHSGRSRGAVRRRGRFLLLSEVLAGARMMVDRWPHPGVASDPPCSGVKRFALVSAEASRPAGPRAWCQLACGDAGGYGDDRGCRVSASAGRRLR